MANETSDAKRAMVDERPTGRVGADRKANDSGEKIMPDRLIRDEILTSERYWSVTIEAQRLFIHLLLVADDLGCFSGSNFTIRTSCFPGQSVEPRKLDSMLLELIEHDLVRRYEVDGTAYLYVPRFKQRLRTLKGKFPAPPRNIMDLPHGMSDMSRTSDGHLTVRRQAAAGEEKRSEVKRSEEKRREVDVSGNSKELAEVLTKVKTGLDNSSSENQTETREQYVERAVKQGMEPGDAAKLYDKAATLKARKR